ncbi:methyltransferase domain-containing protein [candidate division KSB1 bacterium]|nr:methyltransferase domain-containing protein [candidate division KSB1 bacterium]
MRRRNEKLWDNYRQFARARGELVLHILSGYMPIAGAAILDFGCGSGGVALALAAAGAQVTAFDVDREKCALLREAIRNSDLNITVQHDIDRAPAHCDAIILLDVIEHVLNPRQRLLHLHQLLKPDGFVYLSTPNKLSFFNALQDPHFSLPLVSLMRRKCVKMLVADVLRWQAKERIDFPQLLSLRQLASAFASAGFAWHFINTQVVRYAWQKPEAVWNRQIHLALIRFMQKTSLGSAEKIASDEIGFYNRWLNPTWYIVAQKKPER